MYSDNELIALARAGEEFAEEELAKRYSKLVRICARQFFLAGGDGEDLIQEGMLGLLSAIRKYQPDSPASFKTYAEQCIRNRLITAIESASRLKHTPLNEGVSFEELKGKESEQVHYSNTQAFLRQTEEQVLAKERDDLQIIDHANILSKFEREVLEWYLTGMSYKEIADKVNKPEKSIDNAVQRIRKKIAQQHQA